MCRPHRALPAISASYHHRTANILLVSFVAVLASFHCDVSARAVNISNTWILPQEGFPVFYRYFRDRISWYEADAVCQFHHANLVTVDSTGQYDAVRAYLKELDIASYVWVGLSRSDDEASFHWTGQRVLRGDGYWAAAPASASRAHCAAAAADPAADFRWRALPCGGPDIASFICELPVSGWSWARRCAVRALPALTVEWVPERAAVRLTNDCGLAGVRQLYCTQHENQNDILKELSCDVTDGDEAPTTANIITNLKIQKNTKPTLATERESNEDTPESLTHRTQITSATTVPMSSTQIAVASTTILTPESISRILEKPLNVSQITVGSKTGINQPESTRVQVDINDEKKYEFVTLSEVTYHDTTDQGSSTEEPLQRRSANNESQTEVTLTNINDDGKFLETNTNDVAALDSHNKIESTILHNQPSDHFIPPLVMAMSKMNADMNVLSAQEKHAQQIADKKIYKHTKNNIYFDSTPKFQRPITTRNTPLVRKQSENEHNDGVFYIPTKMESPENIENDTSFKEFAENKKSISKKYNQFTDSLDKKTKQNNEVNKGKVMTEARAYPTIGVLYEETRITSLLDQLSTERVLQEMQENDPPTPITLAMMENNYTSVAIDPNIYNLNKNVSIVNESEKISNAPVNMEVTVRITTPRPTDVNGGPASTELLFPSSTVVYDSKSNWYQDEPPRPSRSRKLTKISPRPTRLRILGALG